jgi:hypothetical protein
MGTLKSTKLAWSIAIASLALWATGAPFSSGQVLPIASRLLQQTTDDSTSTSSIDTVVNQTTKSSDDTTLAEGAPCPAVPGAMTQPPAPAPAAPASGAQEGTFHLCGPDNQAARAIEALIAGRSFNASLTSHGDGCADLTIRATSTAASGGSASSTVSVSLGSGQRLSIQIVSEGGATHVNIGQGS